MKISLAAAEKALRDAHDVEAYGMWIGVRDSMGFNATGCPIKWIGTPEHRGGMRIAKILVGGHVKECFPEDPEDPECCQISDRLRSFPMNVKLIDDLTEEDWQSLSPLEVLLIRTLERVNQIALLGEIKEDKGAVLIEIRNVVCSLWDGGRKPQVPTEQTLLREVLDFLASKCPVDIINTDETGVWQWAVVRHEDNEYWLNAFDTKEPAELFCASHDLPVISIRSNPRTGYEALDAALDEENRKQEANRQEERTRERRGRAWWRDQLP